jgi:hypothetical protein
MGDAERTADSYTNTARGLGAAMLDLKVTIGQGLMPAATQANRELADNIRNINDALEAAARSQTTLDTARARGIITEREYQNLLRTGVITTHDGTRLTFELVESRVEAGDAAWEAAAAEDALRRAMSDGMSTTREANEATVERSSVLEEVMRQHESGARAADDYGRALLQLSQGVGIVRVSVDDDELTEASGALDEFKAKYETLADLVEGGELNVNLNVRGEDLARGAEEAVEEAERRLGASDRLQGAFQGALAAIKPQVDFQRITDMEAEMGNVISNVDYINRTTITPLTVNEHVSELEQLAREGRDLLSSIRDGSPYEAELETNLAEENVQLGEFYGQWLRLRSKSISLNVNYNTGGNPHTGPYDTGGGGGVGGPAPNVPGINAPPPSLGFQGSQFGPSSPSIGSLQINVTESGDARRTAEEVVRYLEDRGIVSRVRFR